MKDGASDNIYIQKILKGDKNAIGRVEEIRKIAPIYTTTVNIYEILRGIQLLEKNKENK